jgi:GT2 family glycosyltransferase
VKTDAQLARKRGAHDLLMNGLTRAGRTSSHPVTISIVTLLWRNEAYVTAFLESLTNAADRAGEPIELVVISNGPEGRAALELVRTASPSPYVDITIHELAVNEGFAGGVNAGCRAASGNVIVVANLDLEFDTGFVAELVDVAPTLDVAAFIAPAVSVPPLALHADSPEPTDESADGLVRRDWLHRFQPFVGPRTEGRRVPGANGSCLVFGRSLLERRSAAMGGLFDEEYHSYYEDVDLSWWAEAEDIPTWFDPSLRVAHHQGGSFEGKYRFRDRPADLRASILANYRITVWKNASGVGDAFGWLAGELGYVLLFARIDGWRGFTGYWRSWQVTGPRARTIRARRGALRT